jgi:2-amino-4-hydroxy-6-hydroxymethyldihydropteridine diphosphokinase
LKEKLMRVLLGLGANIGGRAEQLREALVRLRNSAGIRVGGVSGVYESEPAGVKDQPPFLNMAVEIWTEMTPLELLNAVKSLEARMGREKSQRWGPRRIDIDLILAEDRVLDSERLTLPHPAFRGRAFVLAPLAEIAPDAVDPVTGSTVRELADAVTDTGWIERRDDISL